MARTGRSFPVIAVIRRGPLPIVTTDAATVSLKFTSDDSIEYTLFVETPPNISCGFSDEELNGTTTIGDSNEWLIQEFTAPVSGTSRIIETWCRAFNAPTDNLIIEIRSKT